MNPDAFDWGDELSLLWGLAALALGFGFLWLWQWRQSRLAALSRRGPLPRLLTRASGGVFALRASLVIAAALLIAAAIARPRWGASETQVKGLGIDVVIAVDASKSMRVGDIVPTRLEGTKYEINQLLSKLRGGRVALVPFAGLAYTQTPLTTDFEVVRSYLDALRVEDMPRGGTAIGRAILEALEALAPAREVLLPDGESEDPVADDLETMEGAKHKAIVIFTDGEDHEGDAEEAAREAARRGVRVFTVGVGTPQGRPVLELNDEGEVIGTKKGPDGKTPLFSSLNVSLLKKIKDITDGDYFHLGPGGLGDGLVQALGELEKAEYEATYENIGENRYQWAALPALILLFLEAWLRGRRRRRRES